MNALLLQQVTSISDKYNVNDDTGYFVNMPNY